MLPPPPPPALDRQVSTRPPLQLLAVSGARVPSHAAPGHVTHVSAGHVTHLVSGHGANVVAEPAQPTFGGNILVPEGEGSSVAVEGSILASAGTVIIGEDGTRMMSENSALLSDTNTAAEAAAGGTAGTVFTTPDGNTFKAGEGDILTNEGNIRRRLRKLSPTGEKASVTWTFFFTRIR